MCRTHKDRFFVGAAGKGLRVVGAGVEGMWSGDACVALVAGSKAAIFPTQGDASVPAPLPNLSRPYNNAGYILLLTLLLTIALGACGGQAQQTDPRLKYFTVVDSRILIEGNNVKVIGDVENVGKMKFPFDVTMQANLMDVNGQTVGTATGTAEDVGLGQVRQFVLTGTVDGTRYAKLKVIPISLQEKRQELNLPTPTPISP